ncbi:MAG: hypothetical protein EVA89_03360 [Sandaracinaceae bacterium]|nr:MAG: hypothetical protein EVA89_03360 [Sandaracinaceae bacterium]
MRTISLALALIGLAASGPQRVAAQQLPSGSESPASRDARQAFEEGRAHFDDRRYLLAAEAFERAYASMREAGLSNAWMILFNVGTSLDEIRGREQDARDAYVGYLEGAIAAGDQSDSRITLAQSRIRELELRLEAAGARPRAAGTETSVSPVGPIVLGAGGALLLASAISAAVLAVENDALLSTCADGVCPASSREHAESVQGIAVATDVLWVSGAAVAGTGLALTLLLRDASADTPVSAGCGPSECSVQIRGAF